MKNNYSYINMEFFVLFVGVSFVSTCVCVSVIVYAVAVVSRSLTHFGGRPRARFSMIFSVRVKK